MGRCPARSTARASTRWRWAAAIGAGRIGGRGGWCAGGAGRNRDRPLRFDLVHQIDDHRMIEFALVAVEELLVGAGAIVALLVFECLQHQIQAVQVFDELRFG